MEDLNLTLVLTNRVLAKKLATLEGLVNDLISIHPASNSSEFEIMAVIEQLREYMRNEEANSLADVALSCDSCEDADDNSDIYDESVESTSYEDEADEFLGKCGRSDWDTWDCSDSVSEY